MLAEEPVPADADPQGAARGDAPQHGRCRCSAARRSTASACSRCWTPWPPICPARPTCRRSKASIPKKQDAKLVRKPDPDEPFCGLVFKIQADRHGDLHYVRVYSGMLKANSRVSTRARTRRKTCRNSGASRPTTAPRSSRSRPATSSASSACATRSPATRSAAPKTRSCWSRSPSPRRSSRWPSSRKPRPSARSWPTCWT